MDRLLSTSINKDDSEELSLRPTTLEDYVGQHAIKDNLKVLS